MNDSLEKLEKKNFLSLIEYIWDPKNPHFREKYNSLIREAMIDTGKANDTSSITILIKSVPCQKSRSEIINRIERAFPFRWNEKTQSFRYKKLADKAEFSPDDIEKFNAICPVKIVLSDSQIEGAVIIEKSIVTKEEFVDFMLDTIVLNRHVFSIGDLEQIEITLEKIKKKIIKKRVN